MTNCYSLLSSKIEEGIEIFGVKSEIPHVRIGCGDRHDTLHLGDKYDRFIPLFDASRLYQARISQAYRQLRLVHVGEWKGLLLRIKAKNLNFATVKPFSHKLNLNPGGEGVRPAVQCGAHRDRTNKDQLFRLENGESLFVIDQHGAVIVVTCHNGVPVTQKALRYEFINYVINYGLEARRRAETEWAIHTVLALGGGKPPKLLAKLEAVRRE